jgi:hypothetical protein
MPRFAGESGAVPRGAGSSAVTASPGAYDSVKLVATGTLSSSLRRRPVTGALEALADNTQHWTLVSSVSVYVSK